MRNPLATLRVVRVNPTCYDPAISDQTTAAQLREYIQTRDAGLLTFDPAAGAPVFFEVKRLPQAFLADVLDAVYPLASRRLLAFRAACHLVESGDKGPVDYDGIPLRVHPKKTAPKGAAFVATDGDHGTDVAPAEWAQAVADLYGAETIQEIGQVAIDFARLPRGKSGPFSSWGGSVASG